MKFHWTKGAIKTLLWWTLDEKDAAAIAACLGCTKRTVRAMQVELGLKPKQKSRAWTEEEKALIRREYAGTETAKLAKRLKRPVGRVYWMADKLGIRKNHEFLSRQAKKKIPEGFLAGRYAAGHVPMNKGLRRSGWAPGRMAETQFKKGERRGQAAKNWVPVGSISVDTEHYWRVKVREAKPGESSGYGNTKVWPLLNRWIWEQAHGPIPPGHKIVFKDGNRGHCDLKNLAIISNAEMMARNSVHNLPHDLARVIQLTGALKRKLRELHEKGFGNAL